MKKKGLCVLIQPNCKLNQVSENCDFSEHEELCKEASCLSQVFESLNKAKGLSAPQVGVMKRMIIVRSHGKTMVMCNPVVKWSCINLTSNEGCESCKGRYLLKRPSFGWVVWYTVSGEKKCGFFMRDKMRIISHEIDHLNGVLISDKGRLWQYSNLYYQLKSREN